MRIRRLKLSGFKSFVEPAELRIEGGLTGVVGPNGCGKSNLLEALRWVMGESSPKSMRGGGMEDVIFAGTAARPPREFAEVTMLVETDEQDGTAEAEITRRIERGAGSAYRINGRDVRAKDVSLLFADAATGAHSPALVSQGRIGAVIAAKPVERRQMLEEAAGIAGLHVRRKDAEAKLRATEANLERLAESLGDMAARAAALKRQARAAERYRNLSARIRVAEARLVFVRWREAMRAAEAAHREAQAAVAAVEAAAAAQRAAAERQAEAAAEVTRRRTAGEGARTEAARIAHELARLRADEAAARRRLKELTEQQRALTADRGRSAALMADAAASIARLEAELEAIGARQAVLVEARAAGEEALVAAEAASRLADERLAEARSQLASEQAEARVAEAAVASARARLSRADAETQRLEAQLEAVGDRAPLEGEKARAGEAAEAARQLLAASAEMLASAETARSRASAERDRTESAVAAARSTVATLQSEAKALLRTVESGGGDRALDHVRADPGFERALAAALGDDLDASISEQGSRRWTGAEIGEDDPPLPAGTTSLADHVDAPEALKRRLSQIAFAEADDGSVTLLVGQRLVTRDGQVRRWDGYVAEGTGAAAAERLVRLNRLAEIEQALPEAASQLAAAEAERAEIHRQVEAATAAIQAARQDEARATAALRDATRAEDASALALERLELQQSSLRDRLTAAAGEQEAARAALTEAEAAAAALPDPAAALAAVEALQRDAERARATVADMRGEAAARNKIAAADAARLHAARLELEDWQRRSAAAEAHGQDLTGRLEEAEREVASLAAAPERHEEGIAELETAGRNAEAAVAAAAGAERESETTLREADAALAATGESLSHAREQRAGAVARAENQDSRRIEMARISGERFECPPPLLPGRIGFEEETLRAVSDESAELERLTNGRERIGPVILIAERELAELEGAHAASEAEREELTTAVHRLRGSIGRLNREGRARLLEAFEAVDRHFRSLFTTLFDGGQAHLTLVDSDDPLEAGLEIMAQPPGKRLAALTLLSGGEQALTAVALVFALFLTRPAPICVLDEVDAPLDDANVERFCDLLDRMSASTETRYLIVTHNAVTMSRMHRLFGVTMVERGVSRLVSVDLGDAEQLLAAAE